MPGISWIEDFKILKSVNISFGKAYNEIKGKATRKIVISYYKNRYRNAQK